jgi:hypothetical protein
VVENNMKIGGRSRPECALRKKTGGAYEPRVNPHER